MESVSIQRTAFADFENDPSFPALLDEYAHEAAIPELLPHNAQLDTYHQMERAGMLHVITAHKGGQMIGFLVALVNTLPHFGKRVLYSESLFVASQHRKGGAGLKLLAEAEILANEANAVGCFVSAPVGSRLAEVLPRTGYRETNRVFMKVTP